MAQSEKKTLPKLTEMKIKYVGLMAMTPIDVECNAFDEGFGKQIKTKSITDTAFLNIFCVKLASIKETRTEDKLDTRVRVELSYNNGKSEFLCFGLSKKTMVYNGNILALDNELISPILKIIGETK